MFKKTIVYRLFRTVQITQSFGFRAPSESVDVRG